MGMCVYKTYKILNRLRIVLFSKSQFKLYMVTGASYFAIVSSGRNVPYKYHIKTILQIAI